MKSGSGLDQCQAIHAEINALIHCRDVGAVHAAYLTTTPCISCIKALLASSCKRIIASSEYPHMEARLLWLNSGREWLVVHQEVDSSVSQGQRGMASAVFAL
jgi:deoxycytidylate deaminase